jgi:glycosyltransferase involved in cell wall biosynthesis
MILANPFTNDPRVYNEARSLVKAGHKVTVLAWDNKRKAPPSETIDGIKVIRSYNSKFMDTLPYDIFRLHFWWNKGYKDALDLYKENPFDVIHCHDLDTLQIGVKLKKKLKLPLIYDAHEIWGYMISRDLPKIWANYYFGLEKILIKNVDHIITISKPLQDFFKSISPNPITIIMNCKPLLKKKYEYPNSNIFTLLYLGSIGENRFLLELVDVVKGLSDIRCIIGGRGRKDLINSIKEKSSTIKNVDFIGVIPMNEVLPMTKKSDLIICMSNPDDLNSKRGLANKQFEAMVCGRPIICTKDTYSGYITEKIKCGLAALYTKEDLKEKIIKLRDNPKLCEELGKNALNAAIEKYNWKKQERVLLKIYREIK